MKLMEVLLLTSSISMASAKHIMIPSTSFNSQSDFDTDWNYLYPWGSDHNGAARMRESQVSLSDGVLTLRATRVDGEAPAHHGGKEIAIRYLSGAVHAKEHFNVAAGGGYDFAGEFRAPVARGTWPAFWLTGVDSWPPEIDMAEWKGSGKISFNTFNTSSEVRALDVDYPNPDAFHKILCEVRDVNGQDVSVRFSMDGQVVATQYGRGFVGKPLYLIINLQMEGSSGSPGPESDTLFQARNVEIWSYNL
ncbi:glycoside hydrolase family 16 protein [Thermothelomyces heterothallicus CBS 202.75]|uniref:glycoside hydrolase family 16 protein n=1 Tax=Thermothelomyces heterothallicus CBS 202.75 TaxID=1149848 RepID=UPI003742B9B8